MNEINPQKPRLQQPIEPKKSTGDQKTTTTMIKREYCKQFGIQNEEQAIKIAAEMRRERQIYNSLSPTEQQEHDRLAALRISPSESEAMIHSIPAPHFKTVMKVKNSRPIGSGLVGS